MELSNLSSDQCKPEDVPQSEQDRKNRQHLREMLEAMELHHQLNGGYEHKETSWKDLSDQEKIAACTRQTGRVMVSKLPNGHVDVKPIHCNLCEQCYRANALKLKDRIDSFKKVIEEAEVSGQWRKKTVENGTESQSLKKRISRNQEGRYFEVACDGATNDVYIYVQDEPGKDMDEAYGEPVSLDNIDYDAMYVANRSTGKKMSTGKFFRTGSSPGKEGTIRVMIPQFILAGKEGEAENIIRNTNYLHRANTPEEAKDLYNFQLKYIIQELKEADIKILAIEPRFFNFDAKELMNDWNNNINYWLSINTPSTEKSEANMDNDTGSLTSRLYQKAIGEPEKLLN